MIYLYATILLLITGWILLGWMIGESHDVVWLKRWCAPLFVGLAVVLCLCGSGWLTWRTVRAQQRQAIQQLANELHRRSREGRDDDVRAALEFLATAPELGSGKDADILARIDSLNTALSKTQKTERTAERSAKSTIQR